MNKIISNEKMIDEIKNIIINSRKKVSYDINSTMLNAYWNVGRIIVENEQKEILKQNMGNRLLMIYLKNLGEL